MTTDDLAHLDATAQAGLVRAGDVSPAELVDAAIARVEKLNHELNAVIHPLFDRARDVVAGDGPPDGPFRGVPIVVKDLDGTLAGAPYHGGNRLLQRIGHVATRTSHLFARLEAAGFVIVGKTNTPEFGLLPTAEPLAYGPTRNPWNTEHSAGGSSGGSAAAVASGMVPVGHAGDGGGSIRIPASMCGLFGLKPARGRVSLGPHEGESWGGFVCRHVLARSVRDSAAVLDVLQGYMPGDPYTARPPARPYAQEVGADPGRLRIGLRTETAGHLAPTDPECVAAAEDAARLLESLGHVVEPASPAALDEAALMETFSTIMLGALAAELEELGVVAGRPVGPDDVEPLTWMYAEMAAGITAGAYVRALAEAHRWARRVVSWWFDGGFDLLLTPTMAEPPPRIGDVAARADDPYRAASRAVPFAAYTAPFNVTGQPAASVPTYFAASGLPIGVQLVAAPDREDVLVRVGAQLEQARPWAGRRPPVHA
ncbi:MAG: 6-aminohexanoate-cyclic-dimer hydrolase [Acidimicrobiia bacterium]|nr:MAG: 6-aminohexanoate-cyclic-dimer hydrolase [Acidimicrobiia bacterium]